MSGITIKLEGLDTYVEQVVEQAVERALVAREEDPWLDAAAAAEYTGLAVSTIHDYVCDGLLPRHGERKTKLHFRRSELDAFMEGTRIPSNEGRGKCRP